MSLRRRTRVPRSLLEPDGPWTHVHVSAGGASFHVADLPASSRAPHPVPARPVSSHGPIGAHQPDRDHQHAIILLHPFPLTWWCWRDVMVPLSAAGHHVVAMDLRGFGTSDLQAGDADLLQLARDVPAVVGALGIAEFTVVGAGMGGAVAWMVAAMHPVNVRSIVVIGAPHPGSRPFVRLSHLFNRARMLELRMDVPIRRVHVLANGSLVEGMVRHWAAPDHRRALLHSIRPYQAAMTRPFAATVATNLFSATRHLNLASRRALTADVDVPVLSVICGADPSLRPQDFAQDSAHSTGPFTQHVLRGCGHFAPEEAPDQIAALVDRHVRDVAAFSHSRKSQ